MAQLVLQGNASGAVKATADLDRALDRVGDTAKETTRETNKLNRQAERIKEQVEPTRRYNRQLEELARQVRRGAISYEQAQAQAQRYNRTLERAGQTQRRTFGADAAQELAQYATGVIGLQRGIQLVVTAFNQVEEAGRRAVQATTESLGAIGELQQVSRTPEQFLGLLTEARGAVRRGIFRPEELGQAAQLAFGLQSAQFNAQQRELLLGLARPGGPVARESLRGFATELSRFRGPEADQPLQNTINAILATSEATQQSAAETAKAAASTVSQIEALGFGREAGLAAVGTIGTRRTLDEAATRVVAFLTAVEREGLARESLLDTVRGISQREAEGEALSDIIGGNIRAVQGFREIRDNLETFRSIQENIGRSIEQNAIAQRDFVAADPRAQAAAALVGARGRRATLESELLEERRAIRDILVEEFSAAAAQRFRGAPQVAEVLGLISEPFIRAPRTERQFREQIEEALILLPQEIESRQVLEDYLRRSAEAAEQLVEDNRGRRSPQPQGRQE